MRYFQAAGSCSSDENAIRPTRPKEIPVVVDGTGVQTRETGSPESIRRGRVGHRLPRSYDPQKNTLTSRREIPFGATADGSRPTSAATA